MRECLSLSAADSLERWLCFVQSQHPAAIEMGLERVEQVRARMGLELSCPVITVGGTNGKGSTCALLEAMLMEAGYRTGCYTSPHLHAYPERVRIAGRMATEQSLVAGFAAVEAVRGGIPLTYFEFGTLAAAWLLREAQVEAAVLEVGLGGRLDAVNIFDADCAVITSVGIDHVQWLGPTRETIGREKAGIFRAGRPAVIADRRVPDSMLDHAGRVGTRILRLGVEFEVEADAAQWRYRGPGGVRGGLPHPALRGAHQLDNAAAAITALDTLREQIPVDMTSIRRGLVSATLPGRFQVLPGRPVIILDVAHNPNAAQCLAHSLASMGPFHETFAVFGMLADKDIKGVVGALQPHVDRWFVAPLPGPRGASADRIVAALDAQHVLDAVHVCADVADALARARAAARPDDRILVVGSFVTVDAAWVAPAA